MTLLNEKLRKISDSIFQEAEAPEDRSRPLEWRRKFNFVHLPLKNIQIITSCSVHDTVFTLRKEESAEPLNLVKPDISSNIAITGLLDEDKIRDEIFFAVENEEEEGIFSVERYKGKTEITLKVGSPSQGSESMLAGVYWGQAFRMNFDPGEDGLCFDLSIPKDQIQSLVAALRADENATLEVGAHLFSYTFEVDDALREHYHPRDIIIIDSSPCFISEANVTSKIGQHHEQSDYEYKDEQADLYQEEEITPEQRSHQELLQVLLSYSKPLNNIVAALWILIIAIALHAFLN